VLQTLLHGAFVWLQPRSPVVVAVAERGRGPDPPGARLEAGVVVGSARRAAPVAQVDRRAERENRRGGAEESLHPDGRAAAAANHRRANRVAVHLAGKRADAKAAAEGAEDEREAGGKAQAAVAVLVVEHSLPWLG
jgi:hypothetical protein